MLQIDQNTLKAMDTYIQQHISDPLLSVSKLASAFFMSESTLLRRIKYLTGKTPHQYLKELRLQKARRLLRLGVYATVAEVAQEVGFSNARSFTRSYKQRFGAPPSETQVTKKKK
ncbi:MAG: AraC family transcriptional regulator [Bacteroidota bacterium]